MPLVSVGVIDWQYYRPGFREPFITDAQPAMQERAAAEGGDALIVRGHSGLGSSPRAPRVMADVIRFAP